MVRGNNYSGARWAFRPLASGTRPRPASSEDRRPLCPSCGRGYVVRRGVQRCFTLPGEPRCQHATAVRPETSAPQRRRTVTRLGVACLVIGALTSCTPSSPPAGATPAPATATVLRAVDGDTFDVRDDTRGRLRMRVLGIDSPEVHKPGWSVGCLGPEAAKFAADTLTGQRVALVDDPTQDSHDRYGRTLAYVELADGRDFSVTAVAAGMARSYVYDDKPVSRYPDIAAAETQARAARRGLWGPPCEGNTQSAPL